MSRLACTAGLVLLLAAGCRPRSAGPGDPDAPAARTALPVYEVAWVVDGSVQIDGVLDDEAWRGAAWSEPFVAPGDGRFIAESPVNARAKMAWNSGGLYVAFEVADRESASPNARDAVDPHIWESASGIEVMLQPGDPGDNTNYFEIQVDVAGAVWDTRFDDYNRPISGDGPSRRFGHQDWSAELERAVSVVAGEGYTVEMRLPFSALQLPPGTSAPPASGDVWRANLYSFRDGQRHALAWSVLLGQGNFHFAPRFGSLRFAGGPQ